MAAVLIGMGANGPGPARAQAGNAGGTGYFGGIGGWPPVAARGRGAMRGVAPTPDAGKPARARGAWRTQAGGNCRGGRRSRPERARDAGRGGRGAPRLGRRANAPRPTGQRTRCGPMRRKAGRCGRRRIDDVTAPPALANARDLPWRRRVFGGLVRKGGLEPPRLAALEPKSRASTNSATFASRTSYGPGGPQFTRPETEKPGRSRVFRRTGGPSRIRTLDLLIKSQLLYQLS